jgi:hypothetical protein
MLEPYLSQVVHSQVSPFESLMVQSYFQLQFFLANHYMNKSLLRFYQMLLQILCEHVFTHVRVKGQVFSY